MGSFFQFLSLYLFFVHWFFMVTHSFPSPCMIVYDSIRDLVFPYPTFCYWWWLIYYMRKCDAFLYVYNRSNDIHVLSTLQLLLFIGIQAKLWYMHAALWERGSDREFISLHIWVFYLLWRFMMPFTCMNCQSFLLTMNISHSFIWFVLVCSPPVTFNWKITVHIFLPCWCRVQCADLNAQQLSIVAVIYFSFLHHLSSFFPKICVCACASMFLSFWNAKPDHPSASPFFIAFFCTPRKLFFLSFWNPKPDL